MTGLIQFLTKIQTFNLLVVTNAELKSPIRGDGNKPAYSLAHETHYYDSFTYKSEIRVLKDMALIDLLSLNEISLKREFEQLKKLKERFKLIWTNFHQHYGELRANIPATSYFRFNSITCLSLTTCNQTTRIFILVMSLWKVCTIL